MSLKEENEKLREILRRVYNYVPIPDQIRIDSALSQQDGNEVASPAQDEPVGIIQAIDGLEGEDPDEFKEVNVWVDLPVGTKLYATRPAQTAPQPAYVECRGCTECGHVGINDAHQTDATCAMCDWTGPSPVEDQCPDCGKENAMGAACPKCSGRYRILAETHVAAPIAQTEQQA